jgi:hypothetical protein
MRVACENGKMNMEKLGEIKNISNFAPLFF